MTDPEVPWKSAFPYALQSFSIRRGSGGAGRYRGGDGVVRRLRFLEPMTVTTLSLHRKTDPYGLAGGEPGKRGRNAIQRISGEVEELQGSDQIAAEPGDLFIMETPGGGGYGPAGNMETPESRKPVPGRAGRGEESREHP